MKSIKLLLLSIALIANSAYPMAGIAKKAISRLGIGTAFAVANIPLANTLSLNVGLLCKQMPSLNDKPKLQPIITELTDIYGNGRTPNIFVYNSYEDMLNTASRLYNVDELHKQIFKNLSVQWDESHAAAIALPNNNIALSPHAAAALQDTGHPHHYALRGIIGHEFGHLINNDPEKITSLALATGAITNTLLYKGITSSFVKKSHPLLKMFLWPSTIAAKYIIDILVPKSYLAKREVAADFHLLEHAKNHRDLKDLATLCKQRDIIMASESMGIFDPHEHPLTRAAAFEKAADALEQRLAQQKPL